MSGTAPDTFRKHVQDALQHLRGALTELVVSVGADPTRPQEMARRYHLNRNLSWKVSKIIQATDPCEVVPHIPGAAGVDILLGAFETARAPASAIDSVRRAIREFDDAVATHAGDRATFDLMLAGMTCGDGAPAGLERSRKLAFRGSSGVWGIQGKVRLGSHFVAPSAAGDGMLDTAVLGGLVGVRRLRPDVSIPLFMRHQYNDDGSPIDLPRHEPIENRPAGPDDLMLLSEFCTAGLPALSVAPFPGGMRYDLARGPVGNTARMNWIFGWHGHRFACMDRDERNTFGEHATRVFVPVETLLCDLFVHRDLRFAMTPRVALHGQIAGGMPYPASGRDRDRIPFTESIQEIGGRSPVVATPLVPRYPEMVGRVLERLGWRPGDFRGFRFQMKYPPLPSVAVLRYDLPERPAS
jgi:hypothetical protein